MRRHSKVIGRMPCLSPNVPTVLVLGAGDDPGTIHDPSSTHCDSEIWETAETKLKLENLCVLERPHSIMWLGSIFVCLPSLWLLVPHSRQFGSESVSHGRLSLTLSLFPSVRVTPRCLVPCAIILSTSVGMMSLSFASCEHSVLSNLFQVCVIDRRSCSGAPCFQSSTLYVFTLCIITSFWLSAVVVSGLSIDLWFGEWCYTLNTHPHIQLSLVPK